MKFIPLILLGSLTAFASREPIPNAKDLPPPPSIAIDAKPLAKDASVVVTVDLIPPTAQFVIYARMDLSGPPLDPLHASEAAASLSGSFDQLREFARQNGGNLVVLLSNAKGVDLPLKNCATPLRLRSVDPVVTAIIFRWDQKIGLSTLKRVHFAAKMPPGEQQHIKYTIDLMERPEGAEMAYWVYGNISRFVADAYKYDFDTVVIEDTVDREWDAVALPGCDEPVKISRANPKLVVTIFKEEVPNQISEAHKQGEK